MATRHQAPTGTPPTISATLGFIVTGTGFSPGHSVTIRVTHHADNVTDSITYSTDANGRLHAALPTDPHAGTLHISATDYRPDPDGAGGMIWSNTCTITIGTVDA